MWAMFAAGNIEKGESIIQYKGRILNERSDDGNNYLAEITYKRRNNISVTKYVDARNSNCLVNFFNHSCDHYAILCKVVKYNANVQGLWIRVIKNITKNNENFLNYGNERDRILMNNGGCKCNRCNESYTTKL